MSVGIVEELKTWARSENRWMRMGSAVSLIVPAREGRFHKSCLEVAGILLKDEDNLVQKGFGWLLKAASEFNQDLIYDFVMKNKKDLPRTAFRFAIEKMPEARKVTTLVVLTLNITNIPFEMNSQ